MQNPWCIDLVLLKTKSQPDDSYQDYFTASLASPSQLPSGDPRSTSRFQFKPIFVPVLEHKQDEHALGRLGELSRTGRLKDEYGGMIFTSQRAVEGWAETVMRIERETASPAPRSEPLLNPNGGQSSGMVVYFNDIPFLIGSRSDEPLFIHLQLFTDQNPSIKQTTDGQYMKISPRDQAIDERTNQPFTTDIQSMTEFPLYTVGPATSRALSTLVAATRTTASTPLTGDTSTEGHKVSALQSLNPMVLGAHTGNGANLATYILQHYNDLHTQKWFTFYEAPRLPFIPLIGMGSENYSRKRLESTDPRLVKRPLLFLVGEQRRDIIPKTLMNYDQLGEHRAIKVEEVEVYSTIVRDGFRKDFDDLVRQWSSNNNDKDNDNNEKNTGSINTRIKVIVVFSPQGSRDMLKSIGLLDEQGHPIHERIASRWSVQPSTSTTSTDSSINNNDAKNHHHHNAIKSGESVVTAATATNPDPDPKSNPNPPQTEYIITTIGPTTRDYLKTLGVTPDVCATHPTPQGIWNGITEFLSSHIGEQMMMKKRESQ